MSNSPGRFRLGRLFRANIIVMVLLVVLTTWLAAAFALDQRSVFLPGETSHGHMVIEASCSSCHEGFKPITNETCLRCHEAEMAEDEHGTKKFRDPRWAELMEEIEVLTCTACHNEHVHIFSRGVHLHPDLCMHCHEGVINGDLASHEGFSPDGCWTAGCHNFHDHRSISTGFIRQNLDQPDMLPVPTYPDRTVKPQLDRAPAADLGQEFLGGG
ncbi:doubled CXXCH domain protein [Thalassoporum mexicanum PCC 7367]|uniref:cytochrome c3 family protein n=1 Tax=Thalassoporum mexicanum TaxID=3457544 RepID=UPI00029FC840|nr:cytochrome c3 family protein [Pseudanabaena sp. PCC 7367]AFY70922.1 doubled CXXCH domain protein [Pseudanabaena sp. PCC 7367]